MIKFYYFFVGLFFFQTHSQSIYTSENYASVGDVFYLTSATNLTFNFENTSANHFWNFSGLTRLNQIKTQFQHPNETGTESPFVNKAKNTNLSETNNESRFIKQQNQSFEFKNINEYYNKSSSKLKKVATGFKLDSNFNQVPIFNVMEEADVIYKFPIKYNNKDECNSSFTVEIPNFYYQNKTTERFNEVDGWGSVTTPYGTFDNALRMSTILIENDTTSISGKGLPREIKTTREFKWFHPSKKHPVLMVTQLKVSYMWVTIKVLFLDDKFEEKTLALVEKVNDHPKVYSTKININDDLAKATFYVSKKTGKIIYQGKEIDKEEFLHLKSDYKIITVKDKNGVESYRLIKK
jgi:hypothetical protein